VLSGPGSYLLQVFQIRERTWSYQSAFGRLRTGDYGGNQRLHRISHQGRGEMTVAASRPCRTHSCAKSGNTVASGKGKTKPSIALVRIREFLKCTACSEGHVIILSDNHADVELPRRRQRQPRLNGVVTAVLRPIALVRFHYDLRRLGREHPFGANFGDVPYGGAFER
jgi:hypothetical protein